MTTHTDTPVVEAQGLRRVYRQGVIEVNALAGVDLTLARGEFTALAGPSGSGKSTLLNLIGCLDTPSGGTLRVDGRPTMNLTRAQAAEFRLLHVGFIFQAYNLVPVLSAYENAEFTLYLQGIDPAERRRRVQPLLDRVGLKGLEDRRPHEMSGGQQQRVAVVRALASRPGIVLADEPTANLDSTSASSLLDLMEELNQEFGCTFLFASHDALVLERVRRVVRLRDGLIVADERRGLTAAAPAAIPASPPASPGATAEATA
jgi:putative ABC transport system ATP-binding protein